MATVNYKTVAIQNADAYVVHWPNMQNGDTGQAFPGVLLPDRSVQVEGTFGAGGTVVVKGSNDDGTNYRNLTDPQGNDISITASKIEAVTELVQYLRPEVTAGDGTTDLDIYMLVRRI